MTDTLDPEGPSDWPHCNAINGIGPHHYEAVVDVLGRTGLWLYCVQCGEYFQIDTGTGQTVTPQPQSQPQPTPTSKPSWP